MVQHGSFRVTRRNATGGEDRWHQEDSLAGESPLAGVGVAAPHQLQGAGELKGT